MLFESDIEKRLVAGVENLGGVCLKFGQDGWPDRLVVLPQGRLIWVELKRPDGELATLQKWRIKTLRRLGQEVENPWTMEQVLDLLKQWKPPTH